jgi:UPF0271 protein
MKKENTVTINCDMGEGYSLYRCGDDAGIMPHIDLGNVACGFHAADPAVIRDTVKLAAKHGLPVGAHPSFPDRQGFGRRDMVINREELSAIIHYQVSALKGFLDMVGLPLNHIKPHGALYRAAWMREEVSQAIADATSTMTMTTMAISLSRVIMPFVTLPRRLDVQCARFLKARAPRSPAAISR